MIMNRFTRSVALFALAFLFFAAPLQSLRSHDVDVALAASREPVRAKHGVVASTNEVASLVGVDIMKRGGNAVDAAIAVAFALAVTHPAAGNLGGGGFMMIRLKDGRTTAIDYREMAPAAATHDIYLDKNGHVIQGEGGSLEGYRAAGVPGTVRGMELALKKYGSGKLSWARTASPSHARWRARYAGVARLLREQRRLRKTIIIWGPTPKRSASISTTASFTTKATFSGSQTWRRRSDVCSAPAPMNFMKVRQRG
jgi:hypothetical protein